MGFSIYVNINNTFAFYAVDVVKVDTVLDVRRRLEKKSGLTMDNQRCLYHHFKLLDHWTLKDLGIEPHAILTVYLHRPAGLLPFTNAVLYGTQGAGKSPRWPLFKLQPAPDPTRLTFSRDDTSLLAAKHPGRFVAHAGDGAAEGRGWRDALLAAAEAKAAEEEAARQAQAAKMRGLLPGTAAFRSAAAETARTSGPGGAGAGAGAGAGSATPAGGRLPRLPSRARAQRIQERAKEARRLAREREAKAVADRQAAKAARRKQREEAGLDPDDTDSSSEGEGDEHVGGFYSFVRRRRDGLDTSSAAKAGGGASAILGLAAYSRTGDLPVGPNTLTASERLPCHKPFELVIDTRCLRNITGDPYVYWDIKVRLWGGPQRHPDETVETTVHVGWEHKVGYVLVEATDDSGTLATRREVEAEEHRRSEYPHVYNEPADNPMQLTYPTPTKRRAGKCKPFQRRAMRKNNWRLTVDKWKAKLEYFPRPFKQWFPGARYNAEVYGMAKPNYAQIMLKKGFLVFWADRMHFQPRPEAPWLLRQSNTMSDDCDQTRKAPDFELATQGALYWIGCIAARRALRDEPWINPSVAGIVRLARSGGTAGSIHEVANPLNRTSVYTGNVPNSFYTLDLNEFSLIPSAYALRHGYNSSQYLLRSWDLLATNDPPVDTLALLPGEKARPREWSVLDHRENDESLHSAYQAAVFTLNPEVVEGRSFRYFKLIQTAPNSRRNNHMMMVAAWEFFGHVTAEADLDDRDNPGREGREGRRRLQQRLAAVATAAAVHVDSSEAAAPGAAADADDVASVPCVRTSPRPPSLSPLLK